MLLNICLYVPRDGLVKIVQSTTNVLLEVKPYGNSTLVSISKEKKKNYSSNLASSFFSCL